MCCCLLMFLELFWNGFLITDIVAPPHLTCHFVSFHFPVILFSTSSSLPSILPRPHLCSSFHHKSAPAILCYNSKHLFPSYLVRVTITCLISIFNFGNNNCMGQDTEQTYENIIFNRSSNILSFLPCLQRASIRADEWPRPSGQFNLLLIKQQGS